MAVLWTDARNRLWTFPIRVFRPQDDLTDVEKDCISVYNQGLGREIFAADPAPQSPFLKFEAALPGKCHIGRDESKTGTTPQVVGYHSKLHSSPKKTLLHELGHCLGLAHEQNHTGYAWDRADMPSGRSYATHPFDVQELLAKMAPNSRKVPIRRESNKALWLYLRSQGDFHPAKFQETLFEGATKYHDLTGLCDYQSIMMYNLFAEAAMKAKEKNSALAVDYTPTTREALTALDIEGLKALYHLA